MSKPVNSQRVSSGSLRRQRGAPSDTSVATATSTGFHWCDCHRLASGVRRDVRKDDPYLCYADNWDGQGAEAVMHEENRTQAQLAAMADALEGLSAVIAKRAPRFTGH